MKYLKQFLIILAVSFIGEAFHHIIPLPVPASIYGLVLMFILLCAKVLKLDDVKDTAEFLILIMPVMFIPAGVKLMVSWNDLRPVLLPAVLILLVTTVLVFFVTGKTASLRMNALFEASSYIGVVLSLLAYFIGLALKKHFRSSFLNPLLIAIVLVIVFLLFGKIDYDTYNASAKVLSWLLTPATVALAIPLYQQLDKLIKYRRAILVSILAGCLTSLTSVLLFALAFRFTHSQYVTFLPKSITTAIGMALSEEMGGNTAITVAIIILTGILGNVVAEALSKLFHIDDPVARGLAIGTCSHAIGTSKAYEIGEIEGAMSSLAIALSGIFTVILMNIYVLFY